MKRVDGQPPATRNSNARSVSSVDKVIGRRIAERRQELTMSQEALASAIGVAGEQLRKYESGLNRVGAARLLDIGTVLNVPIGYFFATLQLSSAEPEEPSPASPGEGDQAILRAYRAIRSKELRTNLIEIAQIFARV